MSVRSTNRRETGIDAIRHESHDPGLYVHVPFCRVRCTYCDFHVATLSPPVTRKYTQVLIQEIESIARKGFQPRTIFIGGGTPSALDHESWSDLLQALGSHFGEGLSEWTVETNPESIDEKKLEVALQIGVDRISTGAQTFDEKGLSLLGRQHDASRVIEVHQMMQRLGVPRTSLDLIVGWPGQDHQSVMADLAAVEQIDPDHISLYHLSYEKGTWLDKMRSRGDIDPLQDEQCIDRARQFLSGLTDQGYQRYEVSNLHKRGGASLHNLNYWQRGTYLGIGSGAASFHEGKRWKNLANVTSYIESEGSPRRVDEENPDRITAAVETIMLQLRLVSGLDLAEMRTSTGFSIDQICESSLRRFEQRGLLLHEEDRIRITDLGFEILDTIILSLVEELEGASDEKRFDSSNGSDDGTANPSSSGLDRG